MRSSFSIITAATLTTLGVVGTAQADSIYFTYTDGTGLFATLALQISELSPGTWLATSGTMDVTTAGGAIQAGVYSVFAKPSADAHRATSSDGLFWYDNLVFPGNQVLAGDSSSPIGSIGYLDNDGLLFNNGIGMIELNVFGNGAVNAYSVYDQQYNNNGGGTLTLIPLPTTAGLASVGIFAVAGVRRRRSI